MNENKHIINRNTLELTIENQSRGIEIQQKTANAVKNNLQPQFDRLFSNLVSENDHLTIDQLTIDLGTISEHKLEEELVSKSLKQLEEKLSLLLHKHHSEGTLYEGEIEYRPVKSTYTSAIVNKQEIIRSFFLTGQIPWYSSDKDLSATSLLIKELTNKELPSGFLSFLFRLLKEGKVQLRIAYQLTDKQYSILVKKMVSTKKEQVVSHNQILQFIQQIEEHNLKTIAKISYLSFVTSDSNLRWEEVIIQFFKKITTQILSNYSGNKRIQLLSQMVYYLVHSSLTKKTKIQIITFLVQEPVITKSQKLILLSKTNLIKHDDHYFKKLIQSIEDETQANKSKNLKKEVDDVNNDFFKKESPRSKKMDNLPEVEIIKSSNITMVDEESSANEGTGNSTSEDSSIEFLIKDSSRDIMQMINHGITIQNAGVIVLHPFLLHLFDGLNLLDENKHFNDSVAQFKAIHLLQYMANGSKETAEQELTLNKIICGLDLDEPVPLDAHLKESELDECNNLLSVVLEKWSALKTKSINSLRDGFLMREGKISNNNQGWNLFIERNTLDVLLDKLPWSISIISLPWMNELIYTEW